MAVLIQPILSPILLRISSLVIIVFRVSFMVLQKGRAMHIHVVGGGAAGDTVQRDIYSINCNLFECFLICWAIRVEVLNNDHSQISLCMHWSLSLWLERVWHCIRAVFQCAWKFLDERWYTCHQELWQSWNIRHWVFDRLLVDLISFIWILNLVGDTGCILLYRLSMPVFCSYSSLLSSMASRRWSCYGSSSQTWLIQMHIVCAGIAAIILCSSNAFLQYGYVVWFWFSFSNCVCDKGLWLVVCFILNGLTFLQPQNAMKPWEFNKTYA